MLKLYFFGSEAAFKEAKNIVYSTTGEIGTVLEIKFEAIVKRNPDFGIILKVNDILIVGAKKICLR